MVEPLHFRAITARARCELREFTIGGCQLLPFSFGHSLQLEARRNPLVTGEGEVTARHYFEAAAICQEADFMPVTPEPTAEDLAGLDMDASKRTWLHYLDVCAGSRPELWPSKELPSALCAPFEEHVIAYILINSSGYTRRELLWGCVSEVLWIFETIAELVTLKPRILGTGDKAKMADSASVTEVATRKKREKLYGLIQKHVKGSKARQALLAKVLDGTLPRNWLRAHQAALKRKKAGRRNGK